MIGEKRPLQKYKDIDATEMILLAKLILDNNETPDQKKCEYCHEPFTSLVEINHSIEGLSDAYLTADSYIKENKLFTDIDSYDEGGESENIQVHYCPICGRNLSGK